MAYPLGFRPRSGLCELNFRSGSSSRLALGGFSRGLMLEPAMLLGFPRKMLDPELISCFSV